MEGARRAGADDIGRLVELAEEACAAVTTVRGGALLLATHPRAGSVEDFGSLLNADDHLVVAGTIDDQVVGYAVARVRRLPGGQLVGSVDDYYVEPEARGVGVGEAILNIVVEWCVQQGCAGIDAVALPGDRATKNFFESFGMVARAIIVHRSLGAPPQPPSPDDGAHG
ncbi:MAG: GNAT family N-acetyltransferase [Acidimicrobiales bacterium]|nr:GNAT family N-acetyltransferase [Acidimicrobiales bacterium]